MNPGPILIIRNTFPTIAHVFENSSVIKSENTKKNIYYLAIISKTPKHLYLSYPRGENYSCYNTLHLESQ
jgi:hypothetical protein